MSRPLRLRLQARDSRLQLAARCAMTPTRTRMRLRRLRQPRRRQAQRLPPSAGGEHRRPGQAGVHALVGSPDHLDPGGSPGSHAEPGWLRARGGSCDPPAAHAAGWPRRETPEPQPPPPLPTPPRRQDGRCRQRAGRSDDRPGADESARTAPRLRKRWTQQKKKARLQIWPNCYTVGPNLGGYTQWVR